MPDAEKRARADYVIPTGGAFETTRAAVRAIVSGLSGTPDS
jgi:dephospho-CoA kinase